MDPLADLVADGGFRAGLVCGLVAGVGLAAGSPFSRWVRGLSGLAVTGAAVVGLAVRSELPAGLVAGLVVLAVSGWLTDRRRPATRVLAALPGALILARAVDLDGGPGWVRPAVVATVAVGGVLAAGFDRVVAQRPAGRGSGVTPILLAATAIGAYATTPETEHVVVLVGATVPIALLAWWRPPLTLGAVGSQLAVALVAWAVAVDGHARPGAVVGGLACLGVLVLAPLVRRAGHRRRRPRVRRRIAASPTSPTGSVALLAVVHAVLVLVCSRVAGLRTPASEALAISVLAYAAAAGALAMAWRQETTRSP